MYRMFWSTKERGDKLRNTKNMVFGLGFERYIGVYQPKKKGYLKQKDIYYKGEYRKEG